MKNRRIEIGSIGSVLGVIGVALAGLGASAVVWIIVLVIGLVMLAYAFFVGEPAPTSSASATISESSDGASIAAAEGSSVAAPVTQADGGHGDGDARGNILGPNASISIHHGNPASADPMAGRRRLRKTLNELREECAGKTTIRQEAIVQPHLSSWLNANATVRNITPNIMRDGEHRVWVDIEQPDGVRAEPEQADGSGDAEGCSALLEFAPDHQEGLTALDKGDLIEFVGRLHSLDEYSAHFKDCQLLD